MSRRTPAALLLVLALALTPLSARAQATPAEDAIHEVIQRGNAAQAEALAARDPTVLGDTATGAYAQQLGRTNQRLLDAGVQAIELVNIEWGATTVDGTSATAVTFETWRTSFAEGPTEFARDRNVYSLVQDAAGGWRIAGNDHPDGRGRSSAPATSPPPPASDNPPGPGTSRNWSGYAARGGSFSAVSATWTVPNLAIEGPFGADATWVGIGGLRTDDLIQAGTQQAVSGSGTVIYEAWIETLPEVSHPVPLTVLPDDRVNVSVDKQDGDTWQITFNNLTSGQSLQQTLQYPSTLSSAEWIEEAPFARRRVLPISSFGSLTFTAAAATRNGQTLPLAGLAPRAISLVDEVGRMLAVPSPIGPDGATFTVSRT